MLPGGPDGSQPVIMARTSLVNPFLTHVILGRGAELAVANLPVKEDGSPKTDSAQAISGRPFYAYSYPFSVHFRFYVSVIGLIIIISQNRLN